MFIENKYLIMIIANSYTLSDGVYSFDFGNGKKQLFPQSSIILVDDGSAFISVKNTATRKMTFLVRK